MPIIKDTLICFYNLSYPNKHLYLLDDSRYDKPWDTPENVQAYRQSVEELCKWVGVNLFRRKWRGAKAGVINDFVKFLDGGDLEDLEFISFSNSKSVEKPKYIALFDVDIEFFSRFFRSIDCILGEKSRNSSFIQTPQYYSNFELNRVARAAGLQQVIFYEYICENKGMTDSMFCCGSNVLISKEAFVTVGGFDESSVTEDFATSLKLHLLGWRTSYYNKVMAFGMGPEDLNAFFKQQFRWALGTLSLARQLPLKMIYNLEKMPLKKWWEYILSSTYYMIGWFFFIMLMYPILFLFFNIPTFFLDTRIYLVTFFPYLLISLFMGFWTSLRNFTPMHMLYSMLLTSISFPTLMRAGAYSILGIKGYFTVTSKNRESELP